MAFRWEFMSILVCLLTLSIGTFFAEASTPGISSYRLSLLPKRVIKGFTQDVRLRCERDGSAAHKLAEIDRIRVMKKTQTGRWWTIAEVMDYSGEVTADDQVNVTWWMDSTKVEAFLEISWPVATQETFGVYKCELVGFDKHLYHDIEGTSEVQISEQTANAADLYNFMRKLQVDAAARLSRNAAKLKEIKEDREKQLVSEIGKDYVAKDKLLAWPTGEYGLLQPRSGCPVDLAFYGGDTGYIRFKIEAPESSGFAVNTVHDQLNLAAPIVAKGSRGASFSLYFCVVSRVFSSAVWPEGSYCIHQRGQDCPDSFSSTTQHGLTGIESNKFAYGGTVPNLNPTQLCCKESESPDVPIDLPTENPFYLYRHGNSCQQVKNMDVTPEDISLQPIEMHVPVTLQLCYYAKRSGAGES